MEYRIDTGGITKHEITPEGYMRAWGTIARIGVQTYYNVDGTPRKELRPPEEVADPKSLASFGLQPHTVDHPPEFLHSKNAKIYQTGSTDSTVYYKQGFVQVAINVTDAEAIEEISNGKQQLSAGYTCELDFTPGVWRGQSYDAIQRNIRGNHVSSVELGRAGPDVRLHIDNAWYSLPLKRKAFNAKLDAKETMGVKNDQLPPATETSTDKREDAQARRIRELQARLDDREKENVAYKQQVAELESELETCKADTATAKAALENHKATYDSTIASEVSTRIDAWNKARAFLPKALAETPDPKMTADEIKRAAIENHQPGVKLDGYSSDRIDGWFESMLLSAKPKKPMSRPIMQAVENAFNTSNPKDSRTKAMTEDDKAWMTTN